MYRMPSCFVTFLFSLCCFMELIVCTLLPRSMISSAFQETQHAHTHPHTHTHTHPVSVEVSFCTGGNAGGAGSIKRESADNWSKIFTGQVRFMLPKRQCQSAEESSKLWPRQWKSLTVGLFSWSASSFPREGMHAAFTPAVWHKYPISRVWRKCLNHVS